LLGVTKVIVDDLLFEFRVGKQREHLLLCCCCLALATLRTPNEVSTKMARNFENQGINKLWLGAKKS